jgi:hypothetical protein
MLFTVIFMPYVNVVVLISLLKPAHCALEQVKGKGKSKVVPVFDAMKISG